MNPSKLLYVLLFLVCASATRNASADDIDFAHEVVPILRQHCAECHGDREAKGGFSINSRESFLEGDQATPHDADASYFLELIGSDDPDVQMPPPKKPRVSPRERETLVRWVNQGMQWQDDFSFAAPTYDAPLKPRQVKLSPAID